MKTRTPHQSRKSSVLIALVSSLAAVAIGGSAFAQTTWTGAASTTDWGTAGNWSAGVPSANDAILNLTTSPTVDFTAPSTIASLIFSNASGTTTFNASAVMTVTSINDNVFSSAAANGLHLNVNSGGQLKFGGVIQGGNSTVTINSGGLLSWGNSGNNNAFTWNDNGTLTVNAGGQLLGVGGGTANNGMKFSNGAGTATINAAGGNVTMANMLMANRGHAILNITNGGTVVFQQTSGASLTMGAINNGNTSESILNVTNGSVTNASDMYIANGTSAAGNTGNTGIATLTVNGGTVNQAGSTYLGRGRVGIVNVSSGSFAAANDIIIGGLDKTNLAPTGSASASGSLTVSGGTLSTTALRVGDSIVVAGANAGYAVSGSLILSGGTVTTDLLSATNAAAAYNGTFSTVAFNGGALNTKSTSIANGNQFTVGNGSSVAAMKLDGGSHSFANGITLSNNATLSGTGTITTGTLVVSSGATLSPGNSPGILSTQAVTLNGTLAVDINGTTVGTNYDQVNVTGAVNLISGNAITMNLGFTPTYGNNFFLINNDGSDAIVGLLNGYAQDAVFTLASQQWKIGYTGDFGTNAFTGGNDLVLQAVPEPATWALLAGSLTTVMVLRRRRK